MTLVFWLNAVLLAAILTALAFAATALLRPFSVRAGYVVCVAVFLAAALLPLLPSQGEPSASIPVGRDLPLLPLLWIAGSLLLALRELVPVRKRRTARGRALEAEDRARLRVPAGVLVEIVDGAMPMAIGALRPRIILPPAVLTDSAEVTRAILAHEISHARWRDPLVSAMLRWILIGAWPVFPLWIMERLVRREREAAADAAAVSGLDHDAVCSYAEAMWGWAARGSRAAEIGIARSDLEHRVSRLFPSRTASRTAFVAAAVLLLSGAALGLAPSFHAERADAAELSVPARVRGNSNPSDKNERVIVIRDVRRTVTRSRP